jgi:ATP-dependent helicase YprA (DUF1998 family)
VLTVDEDIYRRLPALLISTVDKFARMPWTDKTAALFGHVDCYCPRHGYCVPSEGHSRRHGGSGKYPKVEVQEVAGLLPPELIIQDELHLIAGPLGTMVGLYETAIDHLCSQPVDGGFIPPKVIASTATIRRAADQIRSLFLRDTRQFPPSGIDASDSFFAREVPLTQKSGRLYIGVCAPGRSVKWALIGIYATLLQQAKVARENGLPTDTYWTLVGYFNSLRELGGALRLTEDDIPKRITGMAGKGRERDIRITEELTSRVRSADIPEILAKLESQVDSGRAIDILLASVMLSVGIDVPRLGLMVMNGQPKSTSEYVQATSRVGRTTPGLIVTLYNWYKPRDMSHYERFVAYHSMLYRHVDATSVTPYAARARDRGLKAVIVGMARVLDPELGSNKGASKFENTRPVCAEISDAIERRAGQLEPTEESEVREEISAAMQQWEGLVEDFGDKLDYSAPYFGGRTETHHLLRRYGHRSSEGAWSILDSLRNVELMGNLYYVRSEE